MFDVYSLGTFTANKLLRPDYDAEERSIPGSFLTLGSLAFHIKSLQTLKSIGRRVMLQKPQTQAMGLNYDYLYTLIKGYFPVTQVFRSHPV